VNIQKGVRLASYTTFRIGGPARFFCIVRSEEELVQAVTLARRKKYRILLLGGGSNVLISDDGFPGLVIKNEIFGKGIVHLGGNKFCLSVNSGETWDEIVETAVNNGLYGLENLSAIPGTVGAAPVQNIGAYGSDVSQTITCVRALDLKKLKFVEFSNKECKFSYRDSLFKQKKGCYVITRVDFILTENGKVNIDYKDLKEFFTKKPHPSLIDVRKAVMNIRRKKFPDWKLWGTAGSFFTNPIIIKSRYIKLKRRYPELPCYPEPNGRVKIPLGWILEHICHVKGYMENDVGSYKKQALVIIAKPNATASQIVSYSERLMKLVKFHTGLEITAEVEWVN